MKLARAFHLPAVPVHRSGATLTEVLMSLLIFGLGITSVMALFPISITSSIRATQLTNAKLLEENVRNSLKVAPIVHFDPETNPLLNEGSIALGDGVYPWRQNMEYDFDFTKVIGPRRSSRQSLPVPNMRFLRREGTTVVNGIGFSASTNHDELSGGIEPQWGQLQWFDSPVPANSFWGVLELRTDISTIPLAWEPVPVVIDPIGFHAPELATSQRSFGNVGGLPPGTPPGLHWVHRVDDADGALSFPRAIQTFSLPDSWTVAFEAAPAQIDNANRRITFMPGTDVSAANFGSLASGDVAMARLVFTAIDGSQTAVRLISVLDSQSYQTSVNAQNSLVWSSAESVLPQSMDTASKVQSVRIEVFNPRYTWLLSIPAIRGGNAAAQCVVFFNRQTSLDSERMFPYVFDTAVPDRTQVIVDLTTNPGALPPLIREGGFLFDTRTGKWIRIAHVGPRGATVTITLESPVPEFVRPGATPYAIFAPGVVSVFEVTE